MIKKFIFISIVIISIFSCKQNDSIVDFKEKTNNNIWVGKKVYFFKSIKALKSDKIIKDNNNSKFTIVSYYDGNCSFCFLELAKWSKKMNALNINNNVSFKFILPSDNITSLNINLENIEFPKQLVYHDSKREFGDTYTFLSEKGYKNASILLNQNNEILHIGNPTISKIALKTYLETIKNSTN